MPKALMSEENSPSADHFESGPVPMTGTVVNTGNTQHEFLVNAPSSVTLRKERRKRIAGKTSLMGLHVGYQFSCPMKKRQPRVDAVPEPVLPAYAASSLALPKTQMLAELLPHGCAGPCSTKAKAVQPRELTKHLGCF